MAPPPVSGVLRMVLLLVATGLGLYLVWRLRGVIQLLAISLFFAFALFPLVDAVAARTHAPRVPVILVVYLALALLILLIGYVVVPSLVKEVEALSRNAPHYAAQLRHNPTIRRFDDRYHITAKLVRDAQHLPEELAKLAGPLKDVTVGAAAFITQLLAVLSITFLLILHGRRYAELGLALTGERQSRYRRILMDIKDSVAQYTLGKIVISATATVATWIVLSILGVPYALALGLVVGFFDFIPLIGATLGAIVVAFATLTVDFPTTTIIWVAFIIVWQRIEDYLIQPRVYGKTMNMNPLVTIISLLVGAELLGLLGVLLAIPAAAAIQIILRDWWSFRQEKTTASDAMTDARTAPDHAKRVTTDHPEAVETPTAPPESAAHPPMLTDTRIENDVRSALHSDSRIDRPELIAVSADQIGTVVLSGAVASPPERLAAIHDARQIEGVFTVIADRLKVHLPLPSRRSDDEIAAAGLQRVIDDQRIRSTHIHVKVSHGWVKLTGYVRHESERAAAVEDVASIAGAQGVTDELQVR